MRVVLTSCTWYVTSVDELKSASRVNSTRAPALTVSESDSAMLNGRAVGVTFTLKTRFCSIGEFVCAPYTNRPQVFAVGLRSVSVDIDGLVTDALTSCGVGGVATTNSVYLLGNKAVGKGLAKVGFDVTLTDGGRSGRTAPVRFVSSTAISVTRPVFVLPLMRTFVRLRLWCV